MNILIAGGTGMIGSFLSEKLISKGHQVHILSRHPQANSQPPQFWWDLKTENVDPNAYTGVEAIVNLSGAGVADKRWTEVYKKQILESRTKSAQILLKNIPSNSHIHTYVSASGVAAYGIDTGDKWMSEESPYDSDYLAQVVKSWETEALKAEEKGIRTVCLRTAVVLSGKGGALPKMALPIKLFLGSPFGTGNQYFPWIDIEDLTCLYTLAIESPSMRGIYNAAAPNPVTNREFTESLALHLHRPLWIPNVPAWALKIAVGEMASTLVGGNKVSSQKALDTGFVFASPRPEDSFKRHL